MNRTTVITGSLHPSIVLKIFIWKYNYKIKKSIFFSIFFQNIQDLADDVIMTSSYKLQLDLYINIPNEFGEDRT